MNRRIRFLSVAVAVTAFLLVGWWKMPASLYVPKFGWTSILMLLVFGVLAYGFNFWLAVARFSKAMSVEIVLAGAQVVEPSDDRPRWMISVMDVVAAAYFGVTFATLIYWALR